MKTQAIHTALRDHERVSALVQSLDLFGFAPRNIEEVLVLGRGNSRENFHAFLKQLQPDSDPAQLLAALRREIDPGILERIDSLDRRFPSPPFQAAAPDLRVLLHASADSASPSVLDSLPVEALPGEFLLDLDGFPVAQDQGSTRNTCTAFSIAATLEYMNWRSSAAKVKISEEAIYWLGMKWDPTAIPGGGITLHNTFPVVQRLGVCGAEVWPYRTTKPGVPAFDPSGPWPEPIFRPAQYQRLSPTEHNDLNALKRLLVAGHAVAKNMPLRAAALTTAMYNGHFAFTPKFEHGDGFHAIVLVGYKDGNLHPSDGGGRFIFRNSWGTMAPMQPEVRAGYFSVAYRYFTEPKTMPSYPSAAICTFTPAGLA